MDELKNVILQAKNGKASLDIPIQAIKIATECPRFLELLAEFYREIWVDGNVPPVLSESQITAIWKRKGSKQECKSWRGNNAFVNFYQNSSYSDNKPNLYNL